MKKKILLLATAVICAAIIATGTLAYFTSEDQVHNVITSGAVDITIEEWQEGENGELVPYPREPIPVMPGTDLSKIVTVKNLEAQAWIRARITIVVTDEDGNVMEIRAEDLAKVIQLDINDTEWIDGNDGWYYYNAPVDEGGATAPLFTNVEFSGPEMTNEFQNCTVEIIVDAQGVQTANNPKPDGNGNVSVLDAAGWPGEVIEEEIPETTVPGESTGDANEEDFTEVESSDA